jgi:hypothetical protein
MKERGVTEDELAMTLRHGEQFPAKFGRVGFRHNFPFNAIWNNEFFKVKQVEAFAVKEDSSFLVITVISKFF